MIATWSGIGESVCGILKMDDSDWSNGIRYHMFDTRRDTEFKAPDIHHSIQNEGSKRAG
jgi:hypothetical protein